MEFRNLDSPKKKRKVDVKSHSLSHWMKYCTGQHRGGNTIDIILTFTPSPLRVLNGVS